MSVVSVPVFVRMPVRVTMLVHMFVPVHVPMFVFVRLSPAVTVSLLLHHFVSYRTPSTAVLHTTSFDVSAIFPPILPLRA